MPYLLCPRCKVRCTEGDLSGERVEYSVPSMFPIQQADGAIIYQPYIRQHEHTRERDTRKSVCPACIDEIRGEIRGIDPELEEEWTWV